MNDIATPPNPQESGGSHAPVPAQARLAVWFRVLLAVLFLLVVAGGTVRLTGSGMSIPHWPLIDYSTDPSTKEYSLLPPMNADQWQRISDVYHQEVIKPVEESDWLPIARVKKEFFIEYTHRAVAGLFAVLFLAVIVQVVLDAQARRSIGPMLLASVIVLVSQITLGGHVVLNHTHPLYVSVHLTTAFVFVSLILWMALRLGRPADAPEPERPPKVSRLAWAVTSLCLVQIFLGGIVAKTGAGKYWNTWPRMGNDGPVVPSAEALFIHEPWYRNFLESLLLVQFVHRWFAFAVLIGVAVLVAKLIARPLSVAGRMTLRGVAFVVVFQILLGIVTLLEAVPYSLGIMHLMTGLVLFQLLIALTFEVRNNPALLDYELRKAAKAAESNAREERFDAHAARVS